MKSYLIAFLLPFAALCADEELRPTGEVIVDIHNIHVVSAFDEIAYLTTYSLAGDPVWEVPFNSEIISWKIKDGLLFVFSRARSGLSYFLTCIDANEGKLIWERAIVAPAGS